MKFIEEIASKRTEKEKSHLKTKYGITTTDNPLLQLPIDLHRYIPFCDFWFSYLYFHNRSTPVETLHTLLLGPYKYFLRKLVPRLSSAHKKEICAILTTFNFSGMKQKLDAKLLKHHKSFVGRNFKSVTQCGLFIFRKYFTTPEKKVWTALSKVKSCS